MKTIPDKILKIVVLLSWMALAAPAPGQENSAAADQEKCTQNMLKIYKAIQAYRHDHKALPNWISDLVPDYLKDESALLCPVAARTGAQDPFGIKDPKVKTSYLYEFCAHEIPGAIWGGSKMTMQTWKQLEMGLVGGDVPMLRCHLHSPVLNVGFNGKVYESESTWETRFADVVNPADLSPKMILAKFAAEEPPAAPPVTSRPRQPENPGEALVGKPAPDIDLELLDGGQFKLADYKGKNVLMIDFWATWCGPCRMAMPVLVDLAKEYKDKDVLYFAVDLRETPELISKYLKEQKLDISVPLDKDGAVAKAYRVQGIPSMVIIDKEGVVQVYHIGYSEDLKARMKASLDKIAGS